MPFITNMPIITIFLGSIIYANLISYSYPQVADIFGNRYVSEKNAFFLQAQSNSDYNPRILWAINL